jgi:benzoyl-CoA 2,3-dioxygenase component B
LRDAYIKDCERGVERWNKILDKAGLSVRLRLPNRRFHRHVGIYAGHHFTPDGALVTAEEWQRQRDGWLPSTADLAYVRSLMHPVYERGKIATWIAPTRGVNGQPFDFEYVRVA